MVTYVEFISYKKYNMALQIVITNVLLEDF